ncbi:glycosyl transferase 2 family protein [Collimonas arenae]|uniref:Glycosyl transferase 2 family protein n=1 Tax=Collimonas arenae TaxID=279058 RepID=A0A127PUR9_9BURK|nr:glycosyltransferase family 2 protein [Collimonas arenae]AMP01469.1 glycosyl transferase 2 family protein [Collimonas arenae]AMP11371.1 glycosyl transferase 2 family protein [Collimonas arenae]
MRYPLHVLRQAARYGCLSAPCALFPAIATASEQQAPPLHFDLRLIELDLITAILGFLIFLLVIYTMRHYLFTVNRLFGRQRQPYLDIEQASWPQVVVCVAAHNEERVIADALHALLEVDYPRDKLIIMPMNDRSTDGTREIIDRIAAENPDRFMLFHRSEGRPGKAAALRDATEKIQAEIIIVFDADYLPARGLIKQLVAPFFDPEVGAIMGRVVPINAGANLLTRLLDLERAGGYQVDQAARMNLGLVPQYGGTVGGVRRCALEEIGGWNIDMLAEDTDVTFRLLQHGWKTVYQNRSECYEEVPEVWPVRIRQISRWSRGHNQVMGRNLMRLLRNRRISLRERIDGALLLCVFIMPPLLLVGWALTIIQFFMTSHQWLFGWLALSGMVAYGAFGTNAAFFEMAAATYLDGNRNRIRLLPLNIFGFLISLVSISRAAVSQILDAIRKRELVWHKTERFRSSPASPIQDLMSPLDSTPVIAPTTLSEKAS